MNNLLVKDQLLLDGVTPPYTGEFVDISRIKNSAFISYISGNGTVSLQFESPFFPGSGVTFCQTNLIINNHSNMVSLDTPIKKVRAICSGNGKIWAGIFGQN